MLIHICPTSPAPYTDPDVLLWTGLAGLNSNVRDANSDSGVVVGGKETELTWANISKGSKYFSVSFLEGWVVQILLDLTKTL